jgi:hypothetical protein
MSIENRVNTENRSRVPNLPQKVVHLAIGASALLETWHILHGVPSASAQTPQPSVDCNIEYTIQAVTLEDRRIANLPIDVIAKDQTEIKRFTTNIEGLAKETFIGKSDTTVDGKPGRSFNIRRLGATRDIATELSCNQPNWQTIRFNLSDPELTQVAAPRGAEAPTATPRPAEPTATSTRSPEPTKPGAPTPNQGENKSQESEAGKKEYISNDPCDKPKEGFEGHVTGTIGDMFCHLGQAIHNSDEALAGLGDSPILGKFLILYLIVDKIFDRVHRLTHDLIISSAKGLFKLATGRGGAPAAPVVPPPAAHVPIAPPPAAAAPRPRPARRPRRP